MINRQYVIEIDTHICHITQSREVTNRNDIFIQFSNTIRIDTVSNVHNVQMCVDRLQPKACCTGWLTFEAGVFRKMCKPVSRCWLAKEQKSAAHANQTKPWQRHSSALTTTIFGSRASRTQKPKWSVRTCVQVKYAMCCAVARRGNNFPCYDDDDDGTTRPE